MHESKNGVIVVVSFVKKNINVPRIFSPLKRHFHTQYQDPDQAVFPRSPVGIFTLHRLLVEKKCCQD